MKTNAAQLTIENDCPGVLSASLSKSPEMCLYFTLHTPAQSNKNTKLELLHSTLHKFSHPRNMSTLYPQTSKHFIGPLRFQRYENFYKVLLQQEQLTLMVLFLLPTEYRLYSMVKICDTMQISHSNKTLTWTTSWMMYQFYKELCHIMEVIISVITFCFNNKRDAYLIAG